MDQVRLYRPREQQVSLGGVRGQVLTSRYRPQLKEEERKFKFNRLRPTWCCLYFRAVVPEVCAVPPGGTAWGEFRLKLLLLLLVCRVTYLCTVNVITYIKSELKQATGGAEFVILDSSKVAALALKVCVPVLHIKALYI